LIHKAHCATWPQRTQGESNAGQNGKGMYYEHMFHQIDMIDAQLNERPDGSVEILGQNGYIVVKANYAEKLKAIYAEFLKAYPQKESLKIAVNIELPQPMGSFVNES